MPSDNRSIDYYYAPASPWCYLGHARFVALATERGIAVALKPIDLGRVFPVSGGLPLAQRPAQRRSYRLLELARYAKHLGVPLNPQPRHAPVAGPLASLSCIAADATAGGDAALALAGAIGRALWAEERDIADAATLAAIAADVGLDAAAIAARAAAPDTRTTYDAYTDEAIAAEVFGVPTYVPRFGRSAGERFWGQDRIALLAEAIDA